MILVSTPVCLKMLYIMGEDLENPKLSKVLILSDLPSLWK